MSDNEIYDTDDNSDQFDSSEEYDDSSESYLPETLGTMDQLEEFWEKYANHRNMSSKCYLDGRYFNVVLADFPGLITAPLHLFLNQHPIVHNPIASHRNQENQNSLPAFERDLELEIDFDLDKLFSVSGPLRLMKMLIVTSNETHTLTSVHANLIAINISQRTVTRFEPLHDSRHTEIINQRLQFYFREILPDFDYKMLDCHPQMLSTDSCPSKGMCAAFILKSAMRLILGQPCPYGKDVQLEEHKILVFADAIETEYGPLEGPPDFEFGFASNLKAKFNASKQKSKDKKSKDKKDKDKKDKDKKSKDKKDKDDKKQAKKEKQDNKRENKQEKSKADQEAKDAAKAGKHAAKDEVKAKQKAKEDQKAEEKQKTKTQGETTSYTTNRAMGKVTTTIPTPKPSKSSTPGTTSYTTNRDMGRVTTTIPNSPKKPVAEGTTSYTTKRAMGTVTTTIPTPKQSTQKQSPAAPTTTSPPTSSPKTKGYSGRPVPPPPGRPMSTTVKQ